MKNLKFAAWILFLWLFQTVFLRFIRIDGIAPELLYVFVLCVAMNEKRHSYYICAGAVCGLIADISAGGVPGFYLVAYTVSVFLVIFLTDMIYKDIKFLFIPVVIVFTVFLNTLSYFANQNYFQEITYVSALLSIILPVAAYNCVGAVIINVLLKKTLYFRRTYNSRRFR